MDKIRIDEVFTVNVFEKPDDTYFEYMNNNYYQEAMDPPKSEPQLSVYSLHIKDEHPSFDSSSGKYSNETLSDILKSENCKDYFAVDAKPDKYIKEEAPDLDSIPDKYIKEEAPDLDTIPDKYSKEQTPDLIPCSTFNSAETIKCDIKMGKVWETPEMEIPKKTFSLEKFLVDDTAVEPEVKKIRTSQYTKLAENKNLTPAAKTYVAPPTDKTNKKTIIISAQPKGGEDNLKIKRLPNLKIVRITPAAKTLVGTQENVPKKTTPPVKTTDSKGKCPLSVASVNEINAKFDHKLEVKPRIDKSLKEILPKILNSSDLCKKDLIKQDQNTTGAKPRDNVKKETTSCSQRKENKHPENEISRKEKIMRAYKNLSEENTKSAPNRSALPKRTKSATTTANRKPIKTSIKHEPPPPRTLPPESKPKSHIDPNKSQSNQCKVANTKENPSTSAELENPTRNTNKENNLEKKNPSSTKNDFPIFLPISPELSVFLNSVYKPMNIEICTEVPSTQSSQSDSTPNSHCTKNADARPASDSSSDEEFQQALAKFRETLRSNNTNARKNIAAERPNNSHCVKGIIDPPKNNHVHTNKNNLPPKTNMSCNGLSNATSKSKCSTGASSTTRRKIILLSNKPASKETTAKDKGSISNTVDLTGSVNEHLSNSFKQYPPKLKNMEELLPVLQKEIKEEPSSPKSNTKGTNSGGQNVQKPSAVSKILTTSKHEPFVRIDKRLEGHNQKSSLPRAPPVFQEKNCKQRKEQQAVKTSILSQRNAGLQQQSRLQNNDTRKHHVSNERFNKTCSAVNKGVHPEKNWRFLFE